VKTADSTSGLENDLLILSASEVKRGYLVSLASQNQGEKYCGSWRIKAAFSCSQITADVTN
jgi:hypothetical protein